MKKRLLFVVALAMASSASLFAQSSEGLTQQEVSGTEHVGTWKLVKQKIVFADGKVHIGDSSNVFQRKILTPTHFVVTIERPNPRAGGKKFVASAAGGRYTLVDGQYAELTEYASFPGYEELEVNYELSVEGDTLHTVGKVNDDTFEETYIREN